MQHVSVMFFYPGGVSHGVLPEDATDEEVYETAMIASTIEEGNGNGRIKKRNPELDGRVSR